MAIDIHKLIAAINPDLYCDTSVKSEVKKILKENLDKKDARAYLKAAEKAKAKEPQEMDFSEVYYKGAMNLVGIKNPIERHQLIYDTSSQSLEPTYFWINDNLKIEYEDVEKLIDTFISSPGSGFFSEMGGKSTRMQEEAMKIFGAANTVIKSILNIIYDLKEFQLRLEPYNDLESKEEDKKTAAMLSLKQIWMDTVDYPRRQTTSLKGLAQQFEYVTLIDAFMKSNTLEDVNKLDLNDRVKRILLQRMAEFLKWIELSKAELKKRFEIEKIYLRSQVNTVKLYARWAKPYLRAARQLEQNATPTSDVVTSFNTTVFEVTLLAKGEYELENDVKKGELPKVFMKAKVREYFPIGIVEIKFRSIPERMQQGGYGFRGRADITFTSYSLNEDELKVLRDQLSKDDIDDMMKLVEGATDESLAQIQIDIDEFLKDKEEEKKKKEEERIREDINPFTALFSFFKSEKKDKKRDPVKEGIKPDSSIEKVIRSQAALQSRKITRKIYDGFKKINNMPTMPPAFPM